MEEQEASIRENLDCSDVGKILLLVYIVCRFEKARVDHLDGLNVIRMYLWPCYIYGK